MTDARTSAPVGERIRARRRRSLSPGQRYAVAAVAAITAVACSFADAAPTGIGWLDGCYRMVIGVVLVLAGSRARRWSLIIGSALVAVGSVGAAVVIGLAALGLAVFLVGRNRRDRVVGAVIGGLVSIGTFHLTIGGFNGASALLGLAAASVILCSGYRNTSRRVRRWWRLAMIAVGLAAVAGVVGAVVAAGLVVSDVEDGVDATQAGIAATQRGEDASAVAHFRAARRSLASAASTTGAWWAAPGRAVPVVGQNLTAIHEVSRAGVRLTAAASDIAADVDYERIGRPDGGVDLTVLTSFRGPIVRAALTLRGAERTVTSLSTPWNVAPLQDQLDEFGSKVRRLHRQTALAALAVDRAPSMLGANGERHYLVLLGNPAEARDLGGHLGVWAELDAIDGQLRLAAVGAPLDLSLGLDASADLVATFPPSLTEMKPLLFPQNWGSNPDLPTVASLSAGLYERSTGRSIDGVLYADPVAFAGLLTLTGPMPVAGLPTVTPQNAVAFLTRDQFTAFEDETTANEAVAELVRSTFDRLTRVRLPGPKQLTEVFGPAVREGRLAFASLHPDDEPLLVALGMDGAVQVPEGGDVFGVINRNANPSKIDAYLHRSTEVRANWDPASGEVDETVVVTLRNDAPAGLPLVVLGNQADLPVGTNLTDTIVLSTYRLDRAELDGLPVESSPLLDGGYWRHSVRVELAPGQERTVTYHLVGSLPGGRAYRVFMVGQPLVNAGTTTLHVAPMSGAVRSGRGIRVVDGVGTVRLSDARDALISLGLGD